MNKVYNTQKEIATKIKQFLLNVDPSIRKTQLNIIPYIVIGMILSESSCRTDIAKTLKDDFSLVQLPSITKRFSRLFKNKYFDPYSFYDKIIKHVIKKYKKKHLDKRVHIIIDHMFSHDNFTVFMITMRLGKQCIPLWFRCFKGQYNEDAFNENLLTYGITYVSSLFDSNYDLIFLGDRWFNSNTLMKHIASLGHTYIFRMKKNNNILIYDKKEKHEIWKELRDVKIYNCHSHNVTVKMYNCRYKLNIVTSKKNGFEDPWILGTNGDPKRAIKDYGYRFGGIECLFKNQKSNGFYLEKICKSSIKYFTSMYTIMTFATLYLTILGADYAKNTKCYKKVKITTHTKSKGVKVRIMSLFNTGLTLFHFAYNSSRYIRLPFTLMLYDS